MVSYHQGQTSNVFEGAPGGDRRRGSERFGTRSTMNVSMLAGPKNVHQSGSIHDYINSKVTLTYLSAGAVAQRTYICMYASVASCPQHPNPGHFISS
eukprot:1142727-Pelagomonas_calceolata.AAC.4